MYARRPVGPRRPLRTNASCLVLVATLLACAALAPLAEAWVSFVEQSSDRPPLSLSLAHLVIEDSTAIGFYRATPGATGGGRDSNFYNPKNLFVSGDVVLGRADPNTGALVLGGSSTITTVTSGVPLGRDITIAPNGGVLAVVGSSLLQARGVSSPAGLTISTPSSDRDIVMSPSSSQSSYVVKLPSNSVLQLHCPAGSTCTCSTPAIACTAPVPGVQSNDAAGNLQLLTSGTGAARDIVFNGGNEAGRVQIGGSRSIAADPPVGGTSQDLHVNPVAGGRLFVVRVSDLASSTLVARTVAAPPAAEDLLLEAHGAGHVVLQNNANGKVFVAGRRMISTLHGAGDGKDNLDLTLQAGGSAAVRVGGSSPTVASFVDGAGAAELRVNSHLNGSVVINHPAVPRTGTRGRLVVGGRRTLASLGTNADIVFSPPESRRLLVSGLQPRLTAAPTNASAGLSLRINAGAASAAISLLASGAAAGQGELRVGGERVVATAGGDLTLTPRASGRLLVGRSTPGGPQAVIQADGAGIPNAHLHLLGYGTTTSNVGSVYFNPDVNTGRLFIGGERRIEAQTDASPNKNLLLKPVAKLLIGASATIESAAGATTADIALNPRSGGTVYVGAAGSAAGAKVTSSTGTDASLKLLAADASKAVRFDSRLRMAASFVEAGVNLVLGRTLGQASNVLTIGMASGAPAAACTADNVGSIFYVHNPNSNTASTPAFLAGLNVCVCVPLAGPTYDMKCR